MKKAFNLKFLAIGALLMLGNVCAFAQDPAVDQAVGTSIQGGIVTYRVNNDFAAVKVDGEKTYPVTITGLDADGLDKLGTNVKLEVPVTFREKLGEQYYRFYVTQISEGKGAPNPQSFYGYTEISKLQFVAAPKNSDGTAGTAFYGLDKFTYSVGEKAFYGCTGMKTLEFTENCKTINKYAFQNTSIKTFLIPKQCKTIDEYAFYNCKHLMTVAVAEGNIAMTTLGTHVFGNSSLEVLDLRNASKLETISGEPFMYELSVVNDVLQRVMLPASVKAINTAFAKCTALTGFGLAEDAEGYNADNNPGDLDKTSLGATGGQNIIEGAFEGCRSLTRLNFPNCDIIGTPFAGCEKLATITFVANYDKEIGKTLTAGNNVFGVIDPDAVGYVEKDQKALTTITFKGAFRGTIDKDAFVGTKSLATLTFTGGLQYGATIKAAFTDVTTLATVTINGVDTWNQQTNSSKDDKTITIDKDAFKNTGISSLNFGAIKLAYAKAADFKIAKNAFSECENLATVTFGDFDVRKNGDLAAVFEIEGGAFTKNAALTKVTFGKLTYKSSQGVLKIWDDAFATGNEALAEVEFGDIENHDGNTGYAGTTVIGWDANITSILTDADTEALVFGDGEHLQKVTFGKFDEATNKVGSLECGLAISAGAFASTGLTDVKFGNIMAAKDFATASGFVIGKNAFKGGKVSAKTVTFGNISDNGNGSGNGKLGFAIRPNAFAAEKLATVTFGNLSATNMTIAEKAFEGAALATVTMGNISASNEDNTILQIATKAFWEGDDAVALEVNRPAAKTVTIGEMKDNASKSKTLTVEIKDNAFQAEKLTTVKIAEKSAADATKVGTIGATKVDVTKEAFQGNSLTTVTIGNITAGIGASTLDFGQEAFAGGETEDKNVTIGTITDNGTGKTMTATFGNEAFAGKALNSVTIGDMTATSLTINDKAFAGEKLETVDLGKMTAATLTVKDYAFANQNTEDVMTENITIGEIGAGLTLTAGTDPKFFQGPQKSGSTYNVEIAAITGAATIPANSFVAPAEGTATYTVTGVTVGDDVVAVAASSLTNVAAGAFTGSQVYEKGTPVANNTIVKFQGNYNDDFKASTFTNVNEVEIAVADDGSAYDVNATTGRIAAFAGAKVVTVGNIPAGKQVIANTTPAEQIEAVTFVGSVEGNIRQFTSPAIRRIDFANVNLKDVKVVKGAVKATTFQAAGQNAADNDENITVIYREEQTREAAEIFDQKAFGTAYTDKESITLYTTSWAKANIFEAADLKDANKKAVYRLTYSESEVAPGEDIVATISKKAGNTYGYAKLYIPKGVNMKYKVNAKYDATSDKNAVQLYYARIDNSNNKIFMYNVPVIDGYYWIDCTDVDQAFVLRTNTELESATEIKAEAVTAEEDAEFIPGDADHYYWGAALAVQNQLRYANADIAHSELMNNEEFKDRNVYYMANPAKYGLSFIQFDKTEKYADTEANQAADRVGEYKVLSKKSLYVVGKVNTPGAPELEIVFEGDENFNPNFTGIEDVKVAEQNSDAIYNLQGVRVNNAQKGIFIKNGKKFVVK